MKGDLFVGQLAHLCHLEPSRAKWVIVPARSIAVTLGDRLAREGCDWANLRFVTPRDMAVRMAAPFLLERGIDPSSEALGPALAMRLMLELPGEGGHFRPLSGHPSMGGALWRALSELRHAKVRAAHLAGKRFTPDQEKQIEMAALLSAYERHLETNRLADLPALLEEAVVRTSSCPIRPGDFVIELPAILWSPLVREFLDALPGRRVPALAPRLPGRNVPRREEKLGSVVEHARPDTPSDASLLCFLQSPPDAPPPRHDGTLDIFRAGTREGEIEEVFRRILALGCPIDQVEIACAPPSCQSLVREKAIALDWNVTVSGGVSLKATRPGRLILRFADWVESDFDAADLRRLLVSGDCIPRLVSRASTGEPVAGTGPAEETANESAIDSVSAGQAARLLLEAQATSGRGTYRTSLVRLAEKHERAAADGENTAEDRDWHSRKASRARSLLDWIESSLAMIPSPETPGGDVPLLALAESAASFVNANAAIGSRRDAAARAAITEALSAFGALGEHRCRVPAALSFLRERVESVSVGRDRPRPGHLHVSSLPEAGYDGRRHIFIVGLEEGAVFPAAIEDPILLDDEREAIEPMLRTSLDRQDEAVAAVVSRLAAIGSSAGRVTLSCSSFDTREFRQTFPSWIVLQAFRLMKGDPKLGYDGLDKELGEPVSAVSGEAGAATGEAGWWLSQAKSEQATREAVFREFSSLDAGSRAVAQRVSERFTEFDGHVPEAGGLLDPSRTLRPVSATTLEKAAKCPLRFFMEQGLGIRPLEESHPDEDGWLDALTRGSELHALFARFVRSIRDEKRRPDRRKDLRRMLEWGQRRLEELREEIPPPSQEAYVRESRDFLEDLEAFVEAEAEGRHGDDPVALEVPFGFAAEEGEEAPEALASPEAVPLDLGGGRKVLLRGRIDRINRVSKGRYEVVDYKTGSYWPEAWRGEFAGGTRLQHALYGVAAESLLRRSDASARVIGGRYLFPAVKGHGRRKVIEAPSRAKLQAVMNDLVNVIRNGTFIAADFEGSCWSCEFARACHATNFTSIASKLANAENEMLEPLRRLREHE